MPWNLPFLRQVVCAFGVMNRACAMTQGSTSMHHQQVFSCSSVVKSASTGCGLRSWNLKQKSTSVAWMSVKFKKKVKTPPFKACKCKYLLIVVVVVHLRLLLGYSLKLYCSHLLDVGLWENPCTLQMCQWWVKAVFAQSFSSPTHCALTATILIKLFSLGPFSVLPTVPLLLQQPPVQQHAQGHGVQWVLPPHLPSRLFPERRVRVCGVWEGYSGPGSNIGTQVEDGV